MDKVYSTALLILGIILLIGSFASIEISNIFWWIWVIFGFLFTYQGFIGYTTGKNVADD